MSTNEERVDREDDVNEVLGKGFLDSGNLAECTKPHLRKLIADWFLRRYNWKDAYSVHYSVPPGRARGCYFAGSAIVIILLIVLSVALASGYFARLSCSSVWLQPLLLAGVIVVIVGICILLLTGRHRFLFVRLLATILVGFVPAATGGSLWKLAVEMDWPTLAAVSSATFVAGLVYCAADCARVTSLGKWRALWRALPVTLWGVLFAFVMAIVVSCVVGASMVDSAGAVPAVFYPSLLGTVYPAAVFLFAPVSLFIGLFMNSFWQEKPVTDRF